MISSLSQLDTCGWSYNMILRLMPSVFILQLIIIEILSWASGRHPLPEQDRAEIGEHRWAIIEILGCSRSRNFGQWQLITQEMYHKWLMLMSLSTSGVHMDFRDPLFMQWKGEVQCLMNPVVNLPTDYVYKSIIEETPSQVTQNSIINRFAVIWRFSVSMIMSEFHIMFDEGWNRSNFMLF